MNALRLIPFLLVSLATSFAAAAGVDPNLWLEDIEGAKAIDWVKERNKTSLAELEGDKRYEPLRQEMRAILNAQDKIAWPSWRGGMIYNFWQDAEHVRGLWRRAALAEYRKKDPKWEIILDVDKLGRDENESWVYKGASCRAPLYTKCLLSLSRGGKDAVVVREFDAALSTFVAGGFAIPGQAPLEWLSDDELSLIRFGPGTLTKSGYPRTIRLVPLAACPRPPSSSRGSSPTCRSIPPPSRTRPAACDDPGR